MRLNNVQRNRIISIFYKKKYHSVLNQYEVVTNAAKMENIHISSRGLRNLITKYKSTGFVRDNAQKSSKLLVSRRGLLAINRLLIKNSFLTSNAIKNTLVLTASRRTISRYCGKLGWKKIRTRLLAYLVFKMQIELNLSFLIFLKDIVN